MFTSYNGISLLSNRYYQNFQNKISNGDISFSGIDFSCGRIFDTTSGFSCVFPYMRFSSQMFYYFDSNINILNNNKFEHNIYDEWLLIEWNNDSYINNNAKLSTIIPFFCFSTLSTHNVENVSDITINKVTYTSYSNARFGPSNTNTILTYYESVHSYSNYDHGNPHNTSIGDNHDHGIPFDNSSNYSYSYPNYNSSNNNNN